MDRVKVKWGSCGIKLILLLDGGGGGYTSRGTSVRPCLDTDRTNMSAVFMEVHAVWLQSPAMMGFVMLTRL